ncbi:MAG: DUF4252 domain-containing protein [Krumholzibacteria bacterium]|nr:DUF4252 domain-containing protein [Candidatus Krumholzibacteria bacterium]
MKTQRTLTAALLGLLLLAAGLAPAQDVSKEPGYVDLEWIAIPDDADEIKDIDLSPMLLDFARDARENGDDALVQALAMVRSLRVKAFSVDAALDKEVAATVEKVTARLKKDQWKRLIYVKSDDETVSVNTRYVDDKLVGLMLVVYEPGDSAAFVNVVGDLDLATLLRLAGEIDGDNLESMLEGLEGVEGIEVRRESGKGQG